MQFLHFVLDLGVFLAELFYLLLQALAELIQRLNKLEARVADAGYLFALRVWEELNIRSELLDALSKRRKDPLKRFTCQKSGFILVI